MKNYLIVFDGIDEAYGISVVHYTVDKNKSKKQALADFKRYNPKACAMAIREIKTNESIYL